MKNKAVRQKIFFRAPLDWNLIICVILLNIFGLIMIYSASYYYASSTLKTEPAHFFENQLKYAVAGLVLMIIVSFIGPAFYHHKFFFAASLVLSLMLIVAVRIKGLAHVSHGASRWLKIGPITFQIAEPVKLFLIIFSAHFISWQKFSKESTRTMVYFFTFAMLAAGLWKLSNNMSTAVIVFLNAFFLKMINSKDMKKYFYAMIAAAVIAAIALLLLEYVVPFDKENESFRITRIRAWLHPEDPDFSDAEGYQSRLAVYAIASGGFFGKGLGRSLLKFRLPEPHNDYILSIIFEELGVFGVIILTYLFCYLLYRIFLAYRNAVNRFSANIVLGVFLHLALQIVMNYGVTIGLLPTMGVTLTFISAGGAAVVFSFIELGLVLAAARESAAQEAYKKALKQVSEGNQMIENMIENSRFDDTVLSRIAGFFRRK